MFDLCLLFFFRSSFFPQIANDLSNFIDLSVPLISLVLKCCVCSDFLSGALMFPNQLPYEFGTTECAEIVGRCLLDTMIRVG